MPSMWDRLSITWPLNPHSRFRLVWDLLGLVLVLYDAVTIPLLVLVIPENSPLSKLFGHLSFGFSFFWVLHMLLTFSTGTYINGELCMQYRDIAMHYASTWLPLDALIIVSGWVSFCLSTQFSGLALFRILKAIRLVRLLRVVRIESILREQLRRVNSLSVLNLVHIT